MKWWLQDIILFDKMDFGEQRQMAGRYVQISNGYRQMWEVERIWKLAEELPTEEIELEQVVGIDQVTWFNEQQQPTIRSVVSHCERILNCDLSYPVILTEDFRVFDGMHRIARHLLDGKKTIKVKRFPKNPEPDEADHI